MCRWPGPSLPPEGLFSICCTRISIDGLQGSLGYQQVHLPAARVDLGSETRHGDRQARTSASFRPAVPVPSSGTHKTSQQDRSTSRQDRSLAGKAEEHDRRGQKSGSRRACRKPWHQIRQRAEQTRRHSTWDSPPAPTWPPGPGAPRWTTPPANARGKPSPRRATGTWPPSPGRPPSRSARPRPAKAPATGGYPAAAAKPKLRSPWATPSSRSTTRCCLTPAPGYQDLGPGYHERQRDTRRQIAHRVGKLGALGFEATLCRIPDPNPTRRRPGRLTRQPTPADGGGSTATAD
jgi:hypothetical protein